MKVTFEFNRQEQKEAIRVFCSIPGIIEQVVGALPSSMFDELLTMMIEKCGNENLSSVQSLQLYRKAIFQTVTNILHKIGIPEHIAGYEYIREAIILGVENRNMLDALKKELYPVIAKKFNTEGSCVERAIKYAIERAFKNEDLCEVDSLFKYTVSKKKPTNSEFIARIVDKIKTGL